jgi:hypothetical protein
MIMHCRNGHEKTICRLWIENLLVYSYHYDSHPDLETLKEVFCPECWPHFEKYTRVYGVPVPTILCDRWQYPRTRR